MKITIEPAKLLPYEIQELKRYFDDKFQSDFILMLKSDKIVFNDEV